jgi:hypothetical protein
MRRLHLWAPTRIGHSRLEYRVASCASNEKTSKGFINAIDWLRTLFNSTRKALCYYHGYCIPWPLCFHFSERTVNGKPGSANYVFRVLCSSRHTFIERVSIEASRIQAESDYAPDCVSLGNQSSVNNVVDTSTRNLATKCGANGNYGGWALRLLPLFVP